MNHYLYQLSYTSEAWKYLIEHPQNRAEVVRPVVKDLGGDIVASWVTMGDYDLIAIITLPDEISAAAVLMAFKGGGALQSGKFARLLSWNEAMDAMASAGTIGYQPPGEPE